MTGLTDGNEIGRTGGDENDVEGGMGGGGGGAEGYAFGGGGGGGVGVEVGEDGEGGSGGLSSREGLESGLGELIDAVGGLLEGDDVLLT